MNFGTVAITGAAGTIGSAVRAALRDDAERLVLIDCVPVDQEAENEDTRTVDLRDAAAVEAAMAGVDRVLHLGGVPDEAPLPDLLEANVLGTHHVLEAARRRGIERVVLASSNRVTGFYPTGHLTAVHEPVRPDGLYGVSKAAVEALGRLYADKFGLSVICLRIGSFESAPTEQRHLATWLSPRDAVGYVRAALTAPPSTRFAVTYAVSANTRRFWDVPEQADWAYNPVDDAELHAGTIPGSDVPADSAAPQGGPYTLPAATLKHLWP
ncbi:MULTISPECIES: NAD-dependent epimerase/dehydratase family protein [Streptomyces]|uniref:NAD-dependent epimerase/dehydratase family protein n=1 Tax=Streptomyces TaxID=1883 RepID=UPI001E501326|nr:MULTISPECIES: NAD(P)-dependent oxidoreductase [Streptomyces]UFQ17166.1 NAD(P)-dependent oxidoreductase [Streptomyces huasconensis]WCL86766.1 NAD(P)-dependent oxidoreductase [Streptomyces sp. JCM 35825]